MVNRLYLDWFESVSNSEFDFSFLEKYRDIVASIKKKEPKTQAESFQELLRPREIFAFDGGLELASVKRVIGLTQLPNYSLPKVDETGFLFPVDKGRRTQARVDFDLLDFYVVLSLDSSCLSAAGACAFRWIHGDEEEEVVLRFRDNEVVCGAAIPVHIAERESLTVLICHHNGFETIFIDEVPVLNRIYSGSPITGFTLDIIGGEVEERQEMIVARFHSFGLLDSAANLERDMKFFANSYLEYLANSENLNLIGRHVYSFRDCLNQTIISEEKTVLDDVELAREIVASLIQDLNSHQFGELGLRVQNVDVKVKGYGAESKYKERLLLKDISFDARVGDVIGILGKNGSGKSTLLRAIVGSMPLSGGLIRCYAVPVLLRPGAGFQGELTGRENVYKMTLYAGLSKQEFDRRIKEIAEFSELYGDIDKPFKYYSDGMKSRLIFSFATAFDHDVLLLDELLSAGDVGFQKKAMDRMNQFIADSKIVIVVQHTFDFILSKCTKCLVIRDGRQVYFGDPTVATEKYKEMVL